MYKIITFPDLIIVCGLNVILQELNRIISAVTKTPILLSYDKGDRLGDEYINAANQLLRSQFPDIQGLQSPLLGQRFCFTKFNVVKGYAGCSYIQVIQVKIIGLLLK